MSKAPSPLRAVVYCRVSTREQAREGLSLPIQEAQCREVATRAGYEVVACHIDDGYSGRSSKRPAYRAMLADLSGMDAVFVLRLDRLSRSVRDLFNVLHDLAAARVELRVVHGSVDLNSALGRAMVGMSAVFAALEAELTQERVREAMEDLVRQGRKLSFAPYGYTLPGTKQIIVPDPATAPVVARIYRDYVGGLSSVEIARALNADGIPTARGKPVWRDSQVRALLRRATYIGRVVHSRTGTTLPGLHEPIVPLDLWQRAQDRLRQRTQPGHRYGPADTLSPILYCAVCGSGLCALSSRGERHYRCGANRTRADRHKRVYIAQWIVEGYLWLVAEWLLSDEARVLQQRRTPRRRDGALRRLAARLEELDAEVKYAVDVGRAGGMTPQQVSAQTRPLLDEAQVLQAQLDGAMQAREPAPTRLTRAQLELVRRGPYRQQRETLGKLFARVEVGPETITFRAHGLPDPLTIQRERFHGRQPRDLSLQWLS